MLLIDFMYSFMYMLSAVMDTVLMLLDMLKNPVLLPLAISAVTWLVDRYTSITEGMNDWLKRFLIVAVPAGLALLANFVAAKLGYVLDLSSITAAAGSVVAMLIFMIGKIGKKETA
jgi:hypothetical protein